MKNINTNILYGIIGLLLGLVIIGGFCIAKQNMGAGRHYKKSMTHQMPDGSIMNDDIGMQGMMHSMAKNLEGKKGSDFDKAFLTEMVVHHEGAVVMAKQVLATSKRPELIQLANDIINAQTKEIQMMQQWQKEWFK